MWEKNPWRKYAKKLSPEVPQNRPELGQKSVGGPTESTGGPRIVSPVTGKGRPSTVKVNGQLL